MPEPVPVTLVHGVRNSLVQLTHFIYGLHAIAVLIGVTSSATVAGGFVFGLPSLVAVLLNYLKRGDVNGTWLESHFRWQIRTFWFTALWLVVYGLLIITIIGIPVAWILIAILGLWVGYRVIRGWVALFGERPVA
ncbi:hypothetical protein [Dechloromonas sp. H13]|uniref:DUF4870 family protein n=1 Tax=Dechloromonas sp. H13 TaxID=2570193 RepID=UPI001291599B|nr:hypothetical protein [Dechloromonas sp. H13]